MKIRNNWKQFWPDCCALIKIVMFQWKLDHKVDLSPASTAAVGLQSFFHCHLSWTVSANLTDTAQTHSGLIVVIIFIFYPLLIIITIIIISVKQQCSQAILLCVDRYFIWHQVEGSLNKISKPDKTTGIMSAAVTYSTNEKRFKKIDAWEIQKKITDSQFNQCWAESNIYRASTKKNKCFLPKRLKLIRKVTSFVCQCNHCNHLCGDWSLDTIFHGLNSGLLHCLLSSSSARRVSSSPCSRYSSSVNRWRGSGFQ